MLHALFRDKEGFLILLCLPFLMELLWNLKSTVYCRVSNCFTWSVALISHVLADAAWLHAWSAMASLQAACQPLSGRAFAHAKLARISWVDKDWCTTLSTARSCRPQAIRLLVSVCAKRSSLSSGDRCLERNVGWRVIFWRFWEQK